jgi:hypothetical protein
MRLSPGPISYDLIIIPFNSFARITAKTHRQGFDDDAPLIKSERGALICTLHNLLRVSTGSMGKFTGGEAILFQKRPGR